MIDEFPDSREICRRLGHCAASAAPHPMRDNMELSQAQETCMSDMQIDSESLELTAAQAEPLPVATTVKEDVSQVSTGGGGLDRDLEPPSGTEVVPVSDAEPVQAVESVGKRKRAKKDIRPRPGGMDGEFNRMLAKDLPGVTRDSLLGLNSKGQQFKLEPSKQREDYVGVDTRTLHGVIPSSSRRSLSEIRQLLTKCLYQLEDTSKSNVGEARGWLRHSRDSVTGSISSVPTSRYRGPAKGIRSKRASCSDVQAQTRKIRELEKPFSDNFTANVLPVAGVNSRGYSFSAQDTMHMFCKAVGWSAGQNADDCQNKYFVTSCRQKGGDQEVSAKLKVSTADILLADVFAVDDLMHSAREVEWKNVLIQESLDMCKVGQLIEQLKKNHPKTSIFKNIDADIPKALRLAALYITPIDQDVTADLAGSPNIPKLEKQLEIQGYTIAKQTIGHNALKTEISRTDDGREFKVMVYDKIYETLQQPGKSKEKFLDSKVYRTVNPSTNGLKLRYGHEDYQANGITRVEIQFMDRWTPKQKKLTMQKAVATVLEGLVTKSIHDHIADMEIFLSGVTAMYFPQVHTLKTKALLDTHKKARDKARNEINSIPEGAVIHWKTGTTGKRVGRVVSTDVNLGKGSTGFNKVINCLALETPCNLDITLYVLVDGLEEFMNGGTPTAWFRRVKVEKCADNDQRDRMFVSGHICKGAGRHAETDVPKACGVYPYLLSHIKLAVTKEDPSYENSKQYLKLLGTAGVSPVNIQQRSFVGKGSLEGLPTEFVTVRVIEDRKGKIGRPSKANRPFLAFEYQGDKLRFPDKYQDELWGWRERLSNPEDFAVRVKFSPTRTLEYEIISAVPQSSLLSTCVSVQGRAKCDSDLPVQVDPMKILSIFRKKHARGINYEIDLERHGRFIGPSVTTKNFIECLRNRGEIPAALWKGAFSTAEQSMVDLSTNRYFLVHRTSARGAVRGGKGRDEEWIQVERCNEDGTSEAVLESEGTKRALEREDRPAKRTKLTTT